MQKLADPVQPPTGHADLWGAREHGFAFTQADFTALAQLVHRSAGIVLGATKRDLVYGRLARRLRELGLTSFSAYLDLLDSPSGTAEHEVMINAITTNLTGFFREHHHFEALERDVIPELARARPTRRRLRIWSAGCSSGEEPYSIAMSVTRALPEIGRWDALILATDIDTNMLTRCEAGCYEAAKVAKLSADLVQSFTRPAGPGMVEMDDRLKQLIRFKPLNLLDAWPMQGLFDVIFCRNVVIYFDKATQRTLFDRFAELLPVGGWLFIGHSESLFRVSSRFRHLGRTIYRKIA